MSRIINYLILLAFALLSSQTAYSTEPKDGVKYKDFKSVLGIIKKEYVNDIKDETLYKAALKGMLELDPHSLLLEKKAFDDLKISTQGEFGGLGIEVTMEKGLIRVVSPIDDTPAYKAGIKTGDLIVKINKEAVQGMTLSQAVSKMRGKVDTKVHISIMREGEKSLIEHHIVRKKISLPSVKYSLKDDYLYIRISSFSGKTTSGVKEAFASIKEEQKIKGAILDLRNNPGGLLKESITVADLFLDEGVIVSTKSREGEKKYYAKKGGVGLDIPMVVIINQGSASASEIVSGALQDNKRAIIIGTKSFGKGSVQSVIPINADMAIRLTTAHYYTPSGRSIQAEGISPNIIVPGAKIDFADNKNSRTEADLAGHLENPTQQTNSSNQYQDLVDKKIALYKEDYVLARAIDILNTTSLLSNKRN